MGTTIKPSTYNTMSAFSKILSCETVDERTLAVKEFAVAVKAAGKLADAEVADIDLDEWTNCMTKELRIAIYRQLNNKDKLAGFKPLVDVAKVFDQFDTDNSGSLSKDEIKNAMNCLGLKAWDVNEFFNGLDEDKNGEISLAEFKDNLPSYVFKAMAQKLNDQGLIEVCKVRWGY